MVHYYFGSKDGLLEAIVEQFSSGVFAGPMLLLDKPPRSKDDFLSRFEILFEATLDAYIEQRSVLLVVIREQADPKALPEFNSSIRQKNWDSFEKNSTRKWLRDSFWIGFIVKFN